jgi:hypothetical protein
VARKRKPVAAPVQYRLNLPQGRYAFKGVLFDTRTVTQPLLKRLHELGYAKVEFFVQESDGN